jgi:hypothetical protein
MKTKIQFLARGYSLLPLLIFAIRPDVAHSSPPCSGTCPDGTPWHLDNCDDPVPCGTSRRGNSGPVYTGPSLQEIEQNRIRAVINKYTDLIELAGVSTTGAWDERTFESILATVHQQLWNVITRTEAETQRHRWEMDQFRPHLAALEQAAKGLNVSRHDSVPQSVITAREMTEAEVRKVENEIPKINAETTQEERRANKATRLWVDKRNSALKWMQVYFPVVPNLPQLVDEHTEYSSALHIPIGPFQDHAIEEKPEPLPAQRRTGSPGWHPELMAPPPQPAPLYSRRQGVEQQVVDIEEMAHRAASAKVTLAATKQEMAAFRERYLSYQVLVGKAEDNIYRAECDLIHAESRLHQAKLDREHTNIGRLNATWLSLFTTTKAVAWDAFKNNVKAEAERVTIAAYQGSPLYEISDEYVEKVWPNGQLHIFNFGAKYERAKEYGELVQRALDIEKDAELLSLKAAQTLALGATEESGKIIDDTWAVSGRDGQDTMHKALELVGVPQPAIDRWDNLLRQAGNVKR